MAVVLDYLDFWKKTESFLSYGEAKKMLDNARDIPVKFELAKFRRSLFGWKYTNTSLLLRLSDFVDAAVKEDEENR